MIDATIERELTTCLGNLSVAQQRRVLAFARTLATSVPHGMHGSTLLQFAGTIDVADLDAMSLAIQEGCDGIDADAW